MTSFTSNLLGELDKSPHAVFFPDTNAFSNDGTRRIISTLHRIFLTEQVLEELTAPSAFTSGRLIRFPKGHSDRCRYLDLIRDQIERYEGESAIASRDEERTPVFRPQSLQLKLGRKVTRYRPDPEWVGKVIARIGKEAGIVVEPADERTGRPEKHATAHDLRRSCGERLRDAGVPPLVICRVMRHSSWETTRKHYAPGDIQRDADVLRATLGPSEDGKKESVP